jgi:predicted alpha/beta hydrolase family esterase
MSLERETVARTFSVARTSDSLSLLARAKKMANDTGATLVGDGEAGHFSHVLFKGEYRVTGDVVLVTITDKSWMLPWAVVESRVRELGC